MFSLNVPLILCLMVKTGFTFGYIQGKLREVDQEMKESSRGKGPGSFTGPAKL